MSFLLKFLFAHMWKLPGKKEKQKAAQQTMELNKHGQARVPQPKEPGKDGHPSIHPSQKGQSKTSGERCSQSRLTGG